MDIVYHPGVNGSDPYVEFYPYTPSATAGYAFMALFGISTLIHLILIIPFRAAYFIPLVLGGICRSTPYPYYTLTSNPPILTTPHPGETFGYYGRAWSHESRFSISPWALQEMLIMCAPPLIAATVYMILGRIIRVLDAEHLSSMRPKTLTAIFVTNDILCFCTQLGGAGVQVTGDETAMDIGKKVVLGGLIFSLVVFAGFVLVAWGFHRRLARSPTAVLAGDEEEGLKWRRYMWALYVACFALMVRNLVRTIQFGAGRMAAVNTEEVYIYVFDGFLMFLVLLVLIVLHPGRFVKRVRRLVKVGAFHGPLTAEAEGGHVPLTRVEPRPM